MVSFTLNGANHSVTGIPLVLSSKANESDLTSLPTLDLIMNAASFNTTFLIGPDARNNNYGDFSAIAAENLYFKTVDTNFPALVANAGTNDTKNVNDGALSSGNLLIEEVDGDLTIAAYSMRKFSNDIFGMENLSDIFSNASAFSTHLNARIDTANDTSSPVSLLNAVRTNVANANNMTNSGLMPGTYTSGLSATVSVPGANYILPNVEFIIVDTDLNEVHVKLVETGTQGDANAGGSGFHAGDTLHFTVAGVPVGDLVLTTHDFVTGTILFYASELNTEPTSNNNGTANVNAVPTGRYTSNLGVTVTIGSRGTVTCTSVTVDANSAVTSIVASGGTNLQTNDQITFAVGNISLGALDLVAGNISAGVLETASGGDLITQGASAPTNEGAKVTANLVRQLTLQLAESETDGTRLTDTSGGIFAIENIVQKTDIFGANATVLDSKTYHNATMTVTSNDPNKTTTNPDSIALAYVITNGTTVHSIKFSTGGTNNLFYKDEQLTLTINGVAIGVLTVTDAMLDSTVEPYDNTGNLVTTEIGGLSLAASHDVGEYCTITTTATDSSGTGAASGTGASVDKVKVDGTDVYVVMEHGGEGYVATDRISVLIKGTQNKSLTNTTGIAASDLTAQGALLSYYKFIFEAGDTLAFKLSVVPDPVPLNITGNEPSTQDYRIRITMA